MLNQIKNLGETTELSVLLKKLMFDFYYDQSDFEIETNFFEQLDIGKRGVIGFNEIKAFQQQ